MKLALALAAVSCFAAPADECWKLQHSGQAAQAAKCANALVASPSAAQRAEGLWLLRQYDEANKQFRAAAQAAPKDPAVKVRWGRLLLERFNNTDSADLFLEALSINENYAPALLGLALVSSGNFGPEAVKNAEAALKADPSLVEARELLAILALEDVDPTRAAEQAKKALDASPAALDAMAVLASIDLLADKPSTEWTGRMLAANPIYGEGFQQIARFFVLNRRYEEALTYYRKALDLDPKLESARSEYGVTLMRLGRDQEARAALQQAYEGGYRNSATANSLKLLDSYKNFELIKTQRYILRLHKKEAAVLRPYVEAELNRALDTLSKKYNHTLSGPVQVEFYPDHEDFAVRALGLPGLGALGVTFNLAIAMDSPTGRKPGSFHWASTLWHELSHAYVIEITRQRVPRWFTEGLAVHEETAASPEWGDRLTPEIVTAINDKKLLPIEKLDRGFVRPSYPQQVLVSYFQGGSICDFIAAKWGPDKLMAVMRAFSKVTPTPAVIESVLGVKPEEFDKLYLAYVEQQYGATLKNFPAWKSAMKKYAESARSLPPAEQEKQARAIVALYPEYTAEGNAYEVVAAACLTRGDKPGAIAVLEEYAKQGGREPEPLKQLASLHAEAGNYKLAAIAMQRVIYIDPVRDEEVHRKLGEWRGQIGDWKGAAASYATVVAMNTTDPAGSRYNLARAYQKLGRLDDAQEQVVLALEQAPGYRPAQKLLLELNAAQAKKD